MPSTSPIGPQVAPTVITVNHSSDPDPEYLKVQGNPPISRSHSDRSTSKGDTGDVTQGLGPGRGRKVEKRKIGHRRVRIDGEVTYKKIETTQIMGSIQLGVAQSVGSMAHDEDRDLLVQDFSTLITVPFTKDGTLKRTPAHSFAEFRFKTFAPFAFKTFREMFEIDDSDFLYSVCSNPMIELSNPGVSGSIFYKTLDDMFILKTVQRKEAEFLQKLLPGYYMNLKQNPRTLLPKFFGFYCYSCNAKNVRVIVMNNLLPSELKMHHRFDLKGSTYKRKASRSEREKSSPTFKDLDFVEMFPEGIILQDDIYDNLMNTIQRDCRVLESFKIMDYSLLIGMHNLDQAAKDNEDEEKESLVAEAGQGSDIKSGLERQGSIQYRERTIAHTTALESITMDVDASSLPPSGVICSEYEEGDEVDDVGLENVWGGIPAKNQKGENLLLFIGIIDILQEYGMLKKAEHYWKSLVHDGDTVSVHRPSFYARRFQSFMKEKVFKKAPSALKPNASFRRSQYRRTLSKDVDGPEISAVSTMGDMGSISGEAAGPSRGSKDPSVTVITIGDEVTLPTVLQDRQRKSSNSAKTPSGQLHQNPSTSSLSATRQADLTSGNETLVSHSPAFDERLETGSVITMTSDERVQIYVPSPQTTPYNTITSRSGVLGTPFREDSTPPPFASQQQRMNSSIETRFVTTSTQETSLEMVKISIKSSEATESSTLMDDLPSLPTDDVHQPQTASSANTGPVSLSDIQLHEEET